jgi:cellulose synthase/poly-beta-1,6-N-acetylglucosamine synthase-like glycosyltransferase
MSGLSTRTHRAERPSSPIGRITARLPAAGALLRMLRASSYVVATLVIGVVLPTIVYIWLAGHGLDITPFVYYTVVAIQVITASLIWVESALALRRVDPPPAPVDAGHYPLATAIVAAYLPNETTTILESLMALLRSSYPGRLEVILAYNTPHDLPIEAELQALAASDRRLFLLRVHGSRSKAQNVNAALAHVRGQFVGIFDADHQPEPGVFERAWQWLSNGYDVVQGHCVVRNGATSRLTRLIAVEFEVIYAIAHPGRARLHGFGIFGGSNGFWRTEALRAIRMDERMLTEDIDASMRAIECGYRIASDPMLRSYELSPITVRTLWGQRMRWAQGWLQVALRHGWALLRTPHLTPGQKVGAFHLLWWRELHPWVTLQILPLFASWLLIDGPNRINWFIPIFVATTLLALSSGPAQTIFAYLRAAPSLRRSGGWFVSYALLSMLLYSEFKNVIARVAVLRELMRERHWKVTPREVLQRAEGRVIISGEAGREPAQPA